MGKPALVDIALMADALREIATIVGCPANADPLTDLDGLVMMVRGMAERAETVRVVTADRDALRIRLVTTKAALEAAGYPHVDGQPLADRVAMLAAERDDLRAEVDKRTAPHCQHAMDPGHDLLGRRFVGCDVKPNAVELAWSRLRSLTPRPR